MDKKNIINNFSKAASLYDRYADIQKISASHLLNSIETNGFQNILEIGCGTGILTKLLMKKFGNARFKAVDISGKMLEVAKTRLKDERIDFVAGDAEYMPFDETFDLIASNACFQWFEDLEKVFVRYRDLLKQDGIISFSIFGPLTFHELGVSLKNLSEDAFVEAANFVSKERLKTILEGNFKDVSVEEKIYEEEFRGLKDLLMKIKYTGTANSASSGSSFFGPKKLKELEAIYLSKFKRVKATYQIFFCQGRSL